MKKQLIWALTLVLLALFPYQSVRADYCTKSGTPTDNNNSGRYVSAITITDGNSKSKTISGLQTRTGNVDNIYYDKTSEVFETTAGTTLTFSVTKNWDGAWQGAYVYIDYDCDKTFDTNLNATGTGTGELLINLSGESGSFLSSISSSIITLPANLAPGDYRLRFKSDYNNPDPCGGNSTLVMVDVTLRIPGDSRTLTVLSNSSEAGTVTGGGTIKGGTIITATPNSGYEFINWTDENGNEVSTSRSFDNFYVGDKTYKANFIKPITRSSITVSSEETSGEGATNGRANCIIDGSTSTFWHTKYTGGNANPPHWFMIDLGSVQTFDAFNYVSRGAKLFGNGAINEYRLYVSNSPIAVNNLPEAVAQGAFEYQTTNTSSNTPEHHNIKLANTVSGRYVMLYAVSTWGSASNNTFANCAEFYLYQTNFNEEKYTVTIASNDNAMGTVRFSEGEGSTKEVSSGSSVTIIAEPISNAYKFVQWEDGSKSATRTINNITESATYTATFAAKQTYSVSVSVNDATMGEASASVAEVLEGDRVTLTATPNKGYIFVNWTVGGTEVSTSTTYEATVTEATEYIANFAEKQYCALEGTIAGTTRGVATFTLSDGTNSATAEDVQTTDKSVYQDRTSVVLTTVAGSTITPSVTFCNGWDGAWMHHYMYVDYDQDKEFNTTNNEFVNNPGTGTTDDSYYISNLRPFIIPSDLTSGDYRVRYKIDWANTDPCGNAATLRENGTILDVTIRVVPPTASRTITLETSPVGAGVVKANNTVNGVTAEGFITIKAEANRGYNFVNWTNKATSEVVSTDATFINNQAGDVTYVANFVAKTECTVTVTSVEGGNVTYTVGGVAVDKIYEGDEVTFTAATQAGYEFVRWVDGSGNPLSIANPYTVTVNADMTIAPVYESVPIEIDLFNTSNGSLSIPPYRIPGIAKTRSGRLIAVAARLVCGTDPGYGQVDVVCRTSDNNGVNWSDIKDVAVGNGQTSATQNYFETAYGDPAIVADRTSDEVAIFVVAGCTVYANAKTTRQNPNMIGVIRSTDNGNTWGKPENITEQIYSLFDNGNPIQSAFIAGGKVFQSRIVKVGNYYRLYAAMCARPNGNRVIYSDDFGRTWLPLGGEFALPVPNGDEPKCEELPDGRVIVSSRVASGRYYNIFTYTNTASATGSWQSQTLATLAQGSNATNGEILIVPVVRNSDSKEMYLALQSLPADTNGARKKVTIFYKELTSFDDYNTVTNFASGWDGSYVVTNETSAYSSMDLQADNKIAFIYEKNYTSFGRVANPVSTCFPNGEGDHGYDGYDNTYVSYNLEYITNGAYTVKPNVNRGEIVKGYLTTLVEQSTETADVKAELKTKIAEFGDNPTTAQVDAIYSVLYADPWDGKVVTFTNVQSNGDKRALYINGSNVLSLGTTSQTAESLGASAQFLCIKQANGKYTFKNIATNNYMIWIGSSDGYNNNTGTLSTYNATYCDWSINDANSTKAGTYCLVSKRGDGTTNGSLIVAQSNGAFDKWTDTPICGQHTNGSYYSNVYEIGIVSGAATEELIVSAKEIISNTGVGYPKQGSSARTTLQNAILAAEANPTAAAGITLQNAINTYYTATDIELPANGILYSFIVGHNENKAYIYNNSGTLALAKYTEDMQLPETAKFTCEVNGEYFVFRTSDGKYIAFPNYGVENYTDASPDGIEDNISDLTKFSTTKLLGNGDKVTVSNEDLFGKIYLKVLLRGTVKEGDHVGEKQSGVYVVKFKNNGSVLNPPVWDGASDPYGNDNFSSAISVVAMGYPLTATAEPAGGGTATVSPTSVSAGGSATFTASAANAGYVFDGWYNGNEKLTDELVYNATNITTSLNLTAKYIQQGVVSVTVPTEFGKVMKGEDVVEGSISGNVGDTVQLTAVADEGYIFDRWVVKNTSTNQIRLKSTSTIDVELGTYKVEAYFAPEAYEQICKPTFVKSGNVFTVQSASISDGVGVENIDIVGTAFNMKNAGEVQSDLGEPAQWGATKAVLVEPGATFKLNVEYMKNWADVELFINEGDGFTTIYGPYEGSDRAGLAFENMVADDKISTSGNIASFPITISNNLEGGDIVVIRSASGSFESNACKESLDQGGYLDFIFVVKNLPKRTVSVQVTPIDAAESVTINGLEQTTLTASGDITINVEPKDGYRFVKWTDVLGNDVSTDKEYVDNSTQDTTYVANLVKLWKVTVTTNNRAWGIAEISGVDANGFVDNAADVTLTATSNNDARFIYWGLRTTENGEEVIKPVTTTNPFKTTILRNEDYVAVFEGDYPTMRLKYENGSNIDHEGRVNRYLASVTATAGDLTTVVFEATNESGLPRIDAEVSAFYYYNGENLIPTTSGALIDKTGNAIMVKKGTETITLNFKAWLTNISLRNYSAKPELDETQQAIFVDWNNNKDFLDNGENLGIVSSSAENSFNAPDGYNREISIPASAECGTYRMRVIYYDNLRSSDDWTPNIFEDCVINQGRAYDFEIDIVDDANYITFDAPGETYFNIGDKANIQMTYPIDEAVIYYTTDGFDPDENSPSITNGDSVAINTLQEGTITLKAIAKVGDVKSQVYKAVYTVVSKSSNLGAPTIKSAADATTIVAAEISLGVGIANGPIDYNFTQGQQVKLNAIPTTATATFSLDVTLDLNKYGLLIYRLDALKNSTQKSIKLAASYTADEIVSLSSFKNTLESKGFLYDTIPGAEDKIKIKIPVAMGEFADLSNGESVIYRLIVTNKETENVTLFPDQDYGIGEYVDFVFTVSPQTTKTKVAGGAGKQLSFTITTDDACYLSVGGYAQNIDEAGTTTIQAPLNVVGEMEIQSVGANIQNMDIEILEYGTNVVLPNVDYLGTVTVKSDAELNATTISYASQLPAEGIHLVVEKEIYVPYAINGKTPTYFNFLSLPFEFDCGLNIEYWDGDSWETAVLEKDIRILKYNSRTRSQGKDYYDYTWNTIGGTGGMIYANEGFVLVGNKNYGDADHKMKIRFKSFYPTDNTNVKRELKYFQDGGIKTVGVLPYRNNQGETHVCDADWNHIGSPYLTYTDAIDYVVYYHNGYSYQSVSPSENRHLRPFESFMFQANMEQLNQKDIAFFPLTANKQNAALNVYGRAYLAINGEESVKVILNDEASENFVVNEDGWYMAPTTNVFSTMSLKVAGSEASMSVQPEPNELPLTVYVGANAQQTISLSRFDGENNIFLKDAITEEVVCLNDEDYTFTATPYSTISDRFTITMIEPTGIGDQAKADGNIKAVVTTDGIKLFGTVEGDEVTLYTANGMVIANAIAEDGVTTIPTSAEGVIIIKVADETVKVVK